MDKQLLAKLGRRLYGKSASDADLHWDKLPAGKKREWVVLAARTVTLAVEPRFAPLIDQARKEAAQRTPSSV